MTSKRSKGKSSKSSANRKPELNATKSEQFVEVSRNIEGVSSSSLPFPEWKDADINSERWDLQIKDRKSTKTKDENLESENYFVDPQVVHMPRCIDVFDWKRPHELFPDAKIVVYTNNWVYHDLVSHSRNILHSPFMRKFISSIHTLEYLGNQRPFTIEETGQFFFPNTEDLPWMPWHHVYSHCKAGKGQKHDPQYNKYGKYIIRLFWMGSWRKITVDDFIPVDKMNHVLLPRLFDQRDINTHTHSSSPNHIKPQEEKKSDTLSKQKNDKKSTQSKSKKSTLSKVKSRDSKILKINFDLDEMTVDLWPLLLCKGVIKLWSLSMTSTYDIKEFDIITALTGWIAYKMSLKGLDSMEKWSICTSYTDRYSWKPKQTYNVDKVDSKKSSSSNKKSKSSTKSTKSKSKKSKEGSKKSKKEKKSSPPLNGALPYLTIACFTDLRSLSEDEIPNITPCWSHEFVIDQYRDIPKIEPDPLPELENWKRFRWLKWAVERGFWPEINLPPIQFMKIVSCFKKLSEHITYNYPSEEVLILRKSIIMSSVEEKSTKSKKKLTQFNSDKKSKSSKTIKKSSKKSKSSKTSKKQKSVKLFQPDDPSFWVDFKHIGEHIEEVTVYLKISTFEHKGYVTDIMPEPDQSVMKENKKDKKKKVNEKGDKIPQIPINRVLYSRNISQSEQNNPLLIFIDSIDTKYLVINVEQVGCEEILKIGKIPPNLDPPKILHLCTEPTCPNLSHAAVPVKRTFFPTPGICDPIIDVDIRHYCWYNRNYQNYIIKLQTRGCKAGIYELPPGRSVLGVVIESNKPFLITLLSDSKFTVGRSEYIFELMTEDCEMLKLFYSKISRSLNHLVQAFGTKDYILHLRDFLCSAYPRNPLTKRQYFLIRQVFEREFINSIFKHFNSQGASEFIYAMKVLFLDPSIETKAVTKQKRNSDTPKFCKCSFDESYSIIELKLRNQAATKIQSYYRMHAVRKLMQIHNPDHPMYPYIFDKLKTIYNEMYSVNKRIPVCSRLIRRLLFAKDGVGDLANCYTVYRDTTMMLTLKKFMGTLEADNNSWILVCRYVFYVNYVEPQTVRIHFYTNVQCFNIRVFNNDDGTEEYTSPNRRSFGVYESNCFGYTVLAYVFTHDVHTVRWKLCFITAKEINENILIIPEVNLIKELFVDNYKPNTLKKIFKFILYIKQTIWIAVHTSTSSDETKFSIECKNSFGQIVAEQKGLGGIVIPNICLQMPEQDAHTSKSKKSTFDLNCEIIQSSGLRIGSSNGSLSKKNSVLQKLSTSEDENENEVAFYLEAKVLEDSWPLNLDEWEVVNTLKRNDLLNPHAFKTLDKYSATQLTCISMRSGYNKPFWTLEIYHDSSDYVRIINDKSRLEYLNSIKRSWYENEPDRLEKSINLRDQYLMRYTKCFRTPSVMSFTHFMDMAPTRSYSGLQSRALDKSVSQLLDMESSNIFKYMILTNETSRFSTMTEKTYIDDFMRLSSNTTKSLQFFILAGNEKWNKNPCSIHPNLNLELYYDRTFSFETENRVLLTDALLQEQTEEIQESHLQFERTMADNEAKTQDILEEQSNRDKILNSWYYNDLRSKSKILMNEAYRLREKFIDSLIKHGT